MSFGELKTILETYQSVADDIPDDNTAKAMLAQSMVLGINNSVNLVLGSSTWSTTLPFLQTAINDIPVEQNQAIAQEILTVAEQLWPTFILTAGKSSNKINHLAGLLTRLIQEIRDAPTN